MPAVWVAFACGRAGAWREVNHHTGTHTNPSAPERTKTVRHPYKGANAATTRGARIRPRLLPICAKAVPKASSRGSR